MSPRHFGMWYAGVVETKQEQGGRIVRGSLRRGAACGEAALLSEEAAKETAVALTACTLFGVPRVSFRRVVEPLIDQRRRAAAAYLHAKVFLRSINVYVLPVNRKASELIQ
jgi:CRP-like cAMP-binding protein